MKITCILFFLFTIVTLSVPTFGAYKNDKKTQIGFIVANNVSLHIQPQNDSNTIAILNGHQPVEIIAENFMWYKIKANLKQTGWVYKPYVATESSADSILSSSSLELVSYAKKFINTNYVYGGTTPKGFDCSGFTRYVFLKFGYSFPHHSYDQMTMGIPINRKNLLPADLVFFTTDTSSNVNHVGIYIGEGSFIHASSGSGVVRIDRLTETYYKTRYQGARRIIHYINLNRLISKF